MNVLLSSMDLQIIINSLNKFKENTSPLELSKLFSNTSSGNIYMPLDFMDNFIAYLTEQQSEETVFDLNGWKWKGCDVKITEKQNEIILKSIKLIRDEPVSSDYVNHLYGYLTHQHLLSNMKREAVRRVMFRKNLDCKLDAKKPDSGDK